MMNGDKQKYNPKTNEGQFIEKVRAVAKTAKNENDMIKLIWSAENPLLTVIEGEAYANYKTFEKPLWRILDDLQDQTKIRLGLLDPNDEKTTYSMSVKAAAIFLNVYESTIRNAIKSGGLDGKKRGGKYYLNPSSVMSYSVSNRGGRSCVLKVKAGNIPGASFRIKPEIEIEERFQKTISGTLRNVIKVGVITGKTSGKTKTYRYYELIPGKHKNRLEHEGFYVEGKFDISETILKSKPAAEAYKNFTVA